MSAMILASVNLSNVYSMQPFISPRDPSLSIFPHLYFHALGVMGEAKYTHDLYHLSSYIPTRVS